MTTTSKKKQIHKPAYIWNDIKAILDKELQEDSLLALFKSLYEGNGWIVSTNRIKGEIRSDLLLSYPTSPAQTALIINIVHQHRPLTFTQVRTLLKGFELQKSEAYHCQQFAIVAPWGFDTKCEKLKKYNLLLQDEGHIKIIIQKYSNQKRKQPEIQLFAHNLNTYERVIQLFKSKNRVAIVQATGTGKSYLIAKILSENKDNAPLVMAPSHYILEQIKGHIRWEGDNIKYMTYASSMFITDEKIKALKSGIIILDEFHRCGAEEWGNGVLEILNAYPKAKVLGCSATPVRYLDGARDMSIELFHGNVAENLSLSQAIVKKILPMPKYVSALYSLQEEVEKLGKQIETGNKTNLEKTVLFNKLEVASVNWERTKGVVNILQKYILPGMTKFIIFCREGEHIYEMEQTATGWFKQAFPKRKVITYRVISAEADRNINLKNFIKSDDQNTFHLLLSIDMLNEGMHIDNVSGVILLRPTQSPTIFYQQIGRCLKVGFKGQPLIFDFVNNFQSIRTHDFLNELELFRKAEKETRNELGLEEICPPFTLIDEIKEITEVFGQISFFSDTWEVMFQRLVEYNKRFGNCIVPINWQEDAKLGPWVSQQRSLNFDMLAERRERLEKEGFIWDSGDHRWEHGFKVLHAFKAMHGHCNVSKSQNKQLMRWCNAQRKFHRLGNLKPKSEKKLDKLGFEWEPAETGWEQKFKEYKRFLKQGLKEKELYNPEYKELHVWVLSQRLRKRRNTFEILTPERIERLNKIRMSWNPKNEYWNLMYDKLLKFKKRFGHCRVPIKWEKDPKLGLWVHNMRNSNRRGRLTPEKFNMLDTCGMEWELLENLHQELWDKKYEDLQTFTNQYGHCNVAKNKRSDLESWISKQRSMKRKGILNPDHEQKLDKLGVEWAVAHSEVWKKNFIFLLEYKKQFGHCNVPKNAPEKFKSLTHWVLNQRQYYKTKQLAPYKIKKLEGEGFEWNFKQNELENIFNEHLKVLKEYKHLFGHCNVSTRNSKYKSLANYLQKQKAHYKNGTIDPKIFEALEKEGIEWNGKKAVEERWYKYLEQLKLFKKEYGHCNVPDNNKKYAKLGVWVSNQRVSYKHNKLSFERIELLKNIGFEWSLLYQDSMIWNQRIKELKEFIMKFGHCQVPQIYPENQQLGNWMISVRSRQRKGVLNDQKIAELNELDFPWKLGKGKSWKKKVVK